MNPLDIKNVSFPTVSVIVPTYHRDVSLENALFSLTSQTFKNIEIIVVDDNANDDWSKRVEAIIQKVEALSGHQILYIKNASNNGSAETRNIGIRQTTSEYISFLDDDDVYLPDKIKNQIEYMIKVNADYCITDLDLYDEKGNLVERRRRKYIKSSNKNNLLRYHLLYHMTGTDSMMFKRDYLLKIGGFSPINIGDEFYLMHKAINSGGAFSYLPRCDIQAFVHIETDGLSSGESKIKGENALFEFKKQFFHKLSYCDIRFIKMRHYAVLAFAYLRLNHNTNFIKYALYSFLAAPLSCSKTLIGIMTGRRRSIAYE